MNDVVSVVKCGNYDDAANGIRTALEPLGGMRAFVSRGDRVVIKPNFVSKKKPEEAATTHPQILRAVAEEVRAAGGEAIVAESPGGPYNAAWLKSVYRDCGAQEAVEGTGARLNYDTSFREVQNSDGKILKRIPIISPVLDADKVISLPKLKTHAMTAYTGAVKNLFGVIPGTHKAELHFRIDEREAFCAMLVDLCEFVKPTLTIMDAITGMDGDGPTAGRNREIGIIMASADPYALDMAACKLIDYKMGEVPTVNEAASRGLCPKSYAELNTVGENLEKLVIKDFLKPQSHFNLLKLLSLPPALNKAVKEMLAAKPLINRSECVGCGKCAEVCPPKAIRMEARKPKIDRGKCIKCFCCQELCPQKAVKIHRSAANKIMVKLLK